MTNKEKYQRTFGTLHASDKFLMEVTQMNNRKIISFRRVVSPCAAVILVFAMAGVAYAADLGGIRRTIQLWIHGDQTDVQWEVQDGEYHASYQDADGNTHEIGGGGIAFGPDGEERPLTEEELLEHMDRPDVEYLDDGTVWVFYHNQKVEITDKFNEDGCCFMELKDGDNTQYLTIKYQNGYASSPYEYIQPWEFN